MKHDLHVRMNQKLRTKKDKSKFLYLNTGKYHVSELSNNEITKCLNKLERMKTIRLRVWV
jgi:hypothetical protein